jgi:cobalt-zinc-cadmium efflux system protein
MSHEHASAGMKHRGRLLVVLAATATFAVVEGAVAFYSNSLSLLADAGHMLADVAALSLALIAIWFAGRPANRRKTYGYYRAEILAALANGAILLGISAYILFEAARRLQDPPEVAGAPLLIVATLGLCINLGSAFLLREGAGESLNVRGAFLEVIGDLLGSLGAIAAGLILVVTGWPYADPLFAAAVGLFILLRTWRLLKDALDILLEGTPQGVDVDALQQRLLALPGVIGLHDLHVWTVTSGFTAMSGHMLVAEGEDRDAVLVDAKNALHSDFEIEHVTIQVESPQLESKLEQPCFPGQSPCFADELRAGEALATSR